MLSIALENLLEYGIKKELIQKEDKLFVMNAFLDILGLHEYIPPKNENKQTQAMELEEILKIILDNAVERNFIEDSIVYRDLLDTKLMGAMTPFPREIIAKFNALYKESPQKATDWFYDFSCNTDYIRRYRIIKDKRWQAKTKYGTLDISINLSKPEKDPKAIALAKTQQSASYPKCLLCKENEGFCGSLTQPARQNHRILPITIDNKDWYLQYSPYVYYNEHCILFSSKHEPMMIESATFSKMFDFLEAFPHYFVGSNADLPIVGGSILSHDHFQGGRYSFALDKAKSLAKYKIAAFPNIEIERLHWPLSIIRLTAENRAELEKLSSSILDSWRMYTDAEAFIFAHSNNEAHNTITPIARRVGKAFQIDLVLRNNITTEEHPLGLYHPHAHLHHIKKENIGLIEVMGLAILPARLKDEIEIIKDCLLNSKDFSKNADIEKHSHWIKEVIQRNPKLNASTIDDIIQKEIGLLFAEVLSSCAVFNEDSLHFDRFMKSMGAEK